MLSGDSDAKTVQQTDARKKAAKKKKKKMDGLSRKVPKMKLRRAKSVRVVRQGMLVAVR